MNEQNRMIYIGKYIITFFSLSLICYLFPYSHDDWAWRAMPLRFAPYLNGRYAGHIFTLVLTRSAILRGLTIAFFLTGIIYFIEEIFRNKYMYWVSLLAILALPLPIFKEVVVYTSGFSNYVPPVFFILAAVWIHLIVENKSNWLFVTAKNIALFALALLSSLFIEHITILNVTISLLIMYVSHSAQNRNNRDIIFYASGSLLGGIIMFSNPVYRSVLSKTDEYRTIADGGIFERIYTNYLNGIFQESVFNNILLNFMLICVLVVMILKQRKNYMRKKYAYCLLWTGSLYIVCFWLFSFTLVKKFGYSYMDILPHKYIRIVGLASLLYLMVVIMLSIYLNKTNPLVVRSIIFLWFAYVLVIVPLFIVTPIPSRCFFAPYIILLMIISKLIANCGASTKILNGMKLLVALATILIYTKHYKIYSEIHIADVRRSSLVQSQLLEEGVNNILIYRLPYEEYVLYGTPTSDYGKAAFKKFYSIPDYITLEILNSSEIDAS